MNLHHMLYLGVQNAINSSLIMNACQMSTLLHIDQRLTIIFLHILWLCSPAEDIAGKENNLLLQRRNTTWFMKGLCVS